MSGCGVELTGESLHPGAAQGSVLVLAEPVSFWGGVDERGVVVDVRHPQRGARLAGRIVVMRSGRGSSSSSAVLAEQIRTGNAPAALLLGDRDAVLLLGALVASELYGRSLPMARLSEQDLDRLVTGRRLEVRAGPPPAAATVRRRPGSGG